MRKPNFLKRWAYAISIFFARFAESPAPPAKMYRFSEVNVPMKEIGAHYERIISGTFFFRDGGEKHRDEVAFIRGDERGKCARAIIEQLDKLITVKQSIELAYGPERLPGDRKLTTEVHIKVGIIDLLAEEKARHEG